MRKIITITLNPALDNHYDVPSFLPFGENYIKNSVCSAGGKGVNVSRVLKVLGVDNTAVVVLGEENCERFEPYLLRANMDYFPIYTKGSVRENITIHTEGKDDTRISLDNFSITDDILDKVFASFECTEGDIVVFAGRIPNGTTKTKIIEYLKAIKGKGALLAVDSNSFTMAEITEISPWLIKPNESEIKAITDIEVSCFKTAVKAAEKVIASGVSNVIVSLGKIGAVFSSAKESILVTVPEITPLSTVGAGDSTLAGFIAEHINSADLVECMKNACACGTAACLAQGTEPPKYQDVLKIKEKITVKTIKK